MTTTDATLATFAAAATTTIDRLDPIESHAEDDFKSDHQPSQQHHLKQQQQQQLKVSTTASTDNTQNNHKNTQSNSNISKKSISTNEQINSQNGRIIINTSFNKHNNSNNSQNINNNQNNNHNNNNHIYNSSSYSISSSNSNSNNNQNYDQVLLTPQNRYIPTLPKVIITASASVSDATGKKLSNYSVSNVLNKKVRTAPITYDEYKEDDVPLDPFFVDVPKIRPRVKRATTKL